MRLMYAMAALALSVAVKAQTLPPPGEGPASSPAPVPSTPPGTPQTGAADAPPEVIAPADRSGGAGPDAGPANATPFSRGPTSGPSGANQQSPGGGPGSWPPSR